jgi:hypothetical protein
LTNAPGRFFVACYYRLSPPVAHVIAAHPLLRAGCRILLTPIVWAVEWKRVALCVGIASFLLGIGIPFLLRRKSFRGSTQWGG